MSRMNWILTRPRRGDWVGFNDSIKANEMMTDDWWDWCSLPDIRQSLPGISISIRQWLIEWMKEGMNWWWAGVLDFCWEGTELDGFNHDQSINHNQSINETVSGSRLSLALTHHAPLAFPMLDVGSIDVGSIDRSIHRNRLFDFDVPRYSRMLISNSCNVALLNLSVAAGKL